jgi:Lhr-like helicase
VATGDRNEPAAVGCGGGAFAFSSSRAGLVRGLLRRRPTPAQTKGWAPIARGESTLLLAPTGSGKTLAAFLWCLNRLMFEPEPAPKRRCRVVYVSPLKALAVDVERNLRAPIVGIGQAAARRGEAARIPSILIRTGDTPASERARFVRERPTSSSRLRSRCICC